MRKGIHNRRTIEVLFSCNYCGEKETIGVPNRTSQWLFHCSHCGLDSRIDLIPCGSCQQITNHLLCLMCFHQQRKPPFLDD